MYKYLAGCEKLIHNPECRDCEHAMQCLCGCRAGALETTPDDVLAVDQYTCRIFKQGWIPKIKAAVKQAAPEAKLIGE